MRRMFFALAVALSTTAAHAQSNPNLTFGQVPTPAQWNSYFANKQDFLGFPPCITTGCTLTGPLLTAPSTALAAGFNISPSGVAPTTPNNGDVWETATALFFQINGATQQFPVILPARVTSDFSVTSSTTLANVPGLSVNLQAGLTYSFRCPLFFSTGASAGGVKVALSGTATITNLIADAVSLDSTTVIAGTQISAFASTIIANTNAGTTPKATIEGTITVNAAGTMTVQFAQNASSGTASIVKRGSYCLCEINP